MAKFNSWEEYDAWRAKQERVFKKMSRVFNIVVGITVFIGVLLIVYVYALIKPPIP